MTAAFKFQFLCFQESIDDCNIHFSCFKELIHDCNIHYSFFWFSKQLMTATFNFRSFVSYETIDCNIQFCSVKQGLYWRYI